jgi:hypothetical protein
MGVHFIGVHLIYVHLISVYLLSLAWVTPRLALVRPRATWAGTLSGGLTPKI